MPDTQARLRDLAQTELLSGVRGAQQIQAERALPGQRVVWLLVTDNEHIRHAAAQHFPDLVLTNLKR